MRGSKATGATLLELAVVIALSGLLAAAGAILIGQMAPGYALAAANEQAMAATSAAVWTLRRDFAMTTATSPANGTTCAIAMNQAGGSVRYQLDSQGRLLRNGDILLNGLSATCPFLPSSSQHTLQVSFTVAGDGGQVSIPVTLTLASYER